MDLILAQALGLTIEQFAAIVIGLGTGSIMALVFVVLWGRK